jgi:hypothetical protein
MPQKQGRSALLSWWMGRIRGPSFVSLLHSPLSAVDRPRPASPPIRCCPIPDSCEALIRHDANELAGAKPWVNLVPQRASHKYGGRHLMLYTHNTTAATYVGYRMSWIVPVFLRVPRMPDIFGSQEASRTVSFTVDWPPDAGTVKLDDNQGSIQSK